jgi:hypothetical protein
MRAADPIGHAVTHSDRSTWRSARGLVATWLIVEIAIWAYAWGIGLSSTPDRARLNFPRSPVEVLSTWDGTHYSYIARNGYSTDGAAARRFSFFPLFPAISRLVGGAEHAVLAGILLNQLCLLISILLIGRLVEDGRPTQLSREPGFWILVAPVGFFLSVYYAESLFLLFSLLLVIAYKHNRIAWACLAGFLAGLTRPTAVCLPVLFLPDLIGRLRRGESYMRTIACTAAPLVGVGLYVAYIVWRTGDPLAYMHLRDTWFQAHWTLPFQLLLADLRRFPINLMAGNIPPSDQWVRLASSICILALIAWGWRKIDSIFLIYLVAAMLFIHSQEPQHSTVRWELVLFPVYLLLWRLMAGRPKLAWTIGALCIAAQIFYFYRYATWLWVA